VEEEEIPDQQLHKLIDQDLDVIETYTKKSEWKEGKRTILPMSV